MEDIKLHKRLFYLLVGNLGIIIGISSFPTPSEFTFSSWLGKILFSPFTLLGSVVLYIIGFLAFSFLIRDLILKAYYRRFIILDILFLKIIFISFIFFMKFSIIAAVLAFVLSVSYGIMDADLKGKEKGYKKLG